MNAKVIGYWATTSILVFVLLSGGVAGLMHWPAAAEGMAHLGYPAYFATILGFWKVVEAVIVLAPRLPRLKEWAYAGAFFELTGAFASHAARGDAARYVWPPLVLAGIALASWALRPPGRRLGIIVPAWRRA
jgi:ABC-type enterobactin transport system permease subunit